MRYLYSFGIVVYAILLWVASISNTKARKLVHGRITWKKRLNQIPSDRKVCWIHSASLGEFEQGRPVIEKIKAKHPEVFILLTFYSPSGYEIRKNYDKADLIMYLPADTIRNAKYFVKNANLKMAIFITYEFWYNFIYFAHKHNVALYSISTLFRPGQIFFQSNGKWFRKHLFYFNQFFAQNKRSVQIAKSYNIENVTLAGDTRFDRVSAIAAQKVEIPTVSAFADSHFTIVAGSSWPAEHDMLIRFCNEGHENIKFIIAPHELNIKEYERIESQIRKKVVRLSVATIDKVADASVLIIDSIGLLSKLFRYGNIALIGGGFGKGIHNILEPAVYGLPVIFGPNHEKFHEALTMADRGIAFPVQDYETFSKTVQEFINNNGYRTQKSNQVRLFIEQQLGATDLIMQEIDQQLIND